MRFSRRPPLELVLFVGFALCQLVPLWIVRHVPFQDAPVHLANASILERWLLEDAPELHRAYRLQEGATPGALPHWLLAALLVVSSPRIAVKLLASLCIVLLPLSVRFAAQATGRRAEAGVVAWLAFPFVWNQLLELGLFPFSLGIGLAFLFIGVWANGRDRLGTGRAVAMGGLALALALTHLASLAFGLGVVGFDVVWLAWCRRHEEGARPRALRRAGTALVAVLPALLLGAANVEGSSWANYRGGDENGRDLLTALESTFSLEVLVNHGRLEERLAILVSCLVGALVALVAWDKVRRRDRNEGDGLLLLAGLALVLSVRSRGAQALTFFLHLRWALVANLLAVLWLAGQPLRPWATRALPFAAAALATAFLAVNVERFVAFDPVLDEYLSVVPALPPGQTLLPIDFSPFGGDARGALSSHVAPFEHLVGEVATESHGIDLTNYSSTWRYTPEVKPSAFLKRDQLNACQRYLIGGGAVDQVIVWWPSESDRKREVFAVLARRYKRVFVSEQGHLELYRALKR